MEKMKNFKALTSYSLKHRSPNISSGIITVSGITPLNYVTKQILGLLDARDG